MDQEDIVRATFEEVWNRRDFSAAEDLFATEFHFHVGNTDRSMGIPELEEIVAGWHNGFEDFAFDLHTVVSSHDRAAVHATLTGTHTGKWNGLEPTGNQLRVEHMFFFRFEGDLIVEVWELLDRSELSRQLSEE